jgi:hypothetical protein
MRRILSVVSLSMLLTGFLFLFTATTNVRAEDLTPDQLNQIKSNCVAIKNSLSQLHASDALLRVNRGQTYEAVTSKLMDPFNSRLANNQLDNRAMTAVTSDYRSSLDTFRNDYIAYEQKLSATLRIDCTVKPNTFHNSILEARELRIKVHTDVLRLHQLLDDYHSSVGDFLLNYERVSQ